MFQLRRGHDGPCPLVTRGDSFGATAMGTPGDEFACTCGKVWQIQVFCVYCEKRKIAHVRHSVRPYWQLVEDKVFTHRVLVGLIFGMAIDLTLLIWLWPF